MGAAAKTRVVIFGQDPYPRSASACGVAFLDARVRDFCMPALAPSLKNILKDLLNVDTADKMRYEVRTRINTHTATPEDYFCRLATECGVLWLNTALTYESAETCKKHTNFWRPVVAEAIR